MKQIALALIAPLLLLLAGCAGPEPSLPAPVDSHALASQLYGKGMAQLAASNYTDAYGLFSQAAPLFEKAGDFGMAKNASFMLVRINRTFYEYPFNGTEARQMLEQAFPDIPLAKREEWLAKPTSYLSNQGVKWYYEALVANIYYDEPELMHERSRKAGENAFFDSLAPIAFSTAVDDSQYTNPQNYEATGRLFVPPGSLPSNGTLKLWLPLPIETDSQKNVEVVSITPSEYVKGVPDTTGDVGIAYMEIPLEGMQSGLNVTIVSRFTAYGQRFSIDPENVGEYDRDSALYLKYTRSDSETAYTPEMQELAQGIVGNETNPYLMARMLYWHVINGTTYNSAPHLSLYARGIPETFYAQEYGVGDCGTQSMYFSALCRSLGIPARSPGGYQMIPGHEGTHFWAQVYLPNYGWVPVDTTVAETADWGYNVSEEDGARFKEFYFGNLDSYRLVIQNDVGEALFPRADAALLFPIVLQTAQGSVDNVDWDISPALSNWTMAARPI